MAHSIYNPIVAVGSVFNVHDYGAYGDSVTPCAAQINTAMKACSASGGGYCYVPNGIYPCEKTGSLWALTIPSNVTLIGQGPGAILQFAPLIAENTRLVYTGPNVSNIGVANLTLDGNVSAQDLTGNQFHRDLLFTDNASHVWIRDVECRNGPASGIIIWQNTSDCLVERVYVHNNLWQGIAFGDAGGQTRVTVRNFYITGNDGGLHVENSAQCGPLWFYDGFADCTNSNTALEFAGSAALCIDSHAHNIVCNGPVNIGQAKNCTFSKITATSFDNSSQNWPACKVASTCENIVIRDCTFTLDVSSGSNQAVWLAGNPNKDTKGVRFISNKVIMNATDADGITVQDIDSCLVKDNRVVGNAGIVAATYGFGINLYAKNANCVLNEVRVRDNRIIDFPIGIRAQATGTATGTNSRINNAIIADNTFESISLAMTACMSLNPTTGTVTGHATIQAAEVRGNEAISSIPMFDTYPAVPTLIGGTRGGVEIHSVATDPPSFVAPIGSVAMCRDTGEHYVNKTGLSNGWHKITTT